MVGRHRIKRRRSWRALRIGMDAGSGRIVAATLTDRGVEDASQVAPSLDRISEPVAGDGAYDRNQGYAAVHERHPEAAVVAPPRVPGATATSRPSLRRAGWRGRGPAAPTRGDGVGSQMARWKAVPRRHGSQPHARPRAPERRPRRLITSGAGVISCTARLAATRRQERKSSRFPTWRNHASSEKRVAIWLRARAAIAWAPSGSLRSHRSHRAASATSGSAQDWSGWW